MQPNEHLKKVMKILIFAFLCTEMRTSYTHRDGTRKQRGIESPNGNRRQSRAPFQASIRLRSLEVDYYGKGHICSGALVASSVVLTMGNCLYNNASKSFYHPAELLVQLGSRQRFAPTAQSQVYGVTHVYHPPKSLSLAILMLDQDVPADQSDIQPIALASTAPLGSQLLLSSWGLTTGDEHHDHDHDDHDHRELHEMLNVAVDCNIKQYCKPSYETKKYLSYQLDAGAPLVGKDNRLLGLFSSTLSTDSSWTFVDVASHVDWIQSKIGDGSTQNSSWWGILGLLVFTGYVIKCSRKSFL
ncbi:serine protease 30 [Drosophila sulfurigaster albostrigata]|uniref:serine protease 30 n=1 Tax=Drosophila sulfurigaster albostrigata TaxID=89887 RepID=UPI002D21BFE6|nr:serine protease 30 [Drosophila sulfurigaster albostrigata]